MNHQDNPQQPAIYVLFSAVVLGLASFIIWLLRTGQGSKEQKRPLPGGQSRLDSAAGGTLRPGTGTAIAPDADSTAALRASAAQVGAMKHAPELAMGSVEMPAAPEAGAAQGAVAVPAVQAATPNSVSLTRWTAPTRYMAGAGLVLFFVWLVSYSRQSLTLLIFAALIAILVQPVIHFMNRRFRFSQNLAVVFTYLLVGFLLVALPIIVIPNILDGINSLLDYNWQGLINQITEALNGVATQVSTVPLLGRELAGSFRSLSSLTQNLLVAEPEQALTTLSATDLLNQLGKTIGLLASLLGPAVSAILSVIFMVLISMQMSLTGGQIRGWIIKPVPQRFKEEIGALLDRIQLVWVSFLRGQFVLMVVMGILVWLMNALLGTPQAMLLGALAGLLEVVPSLGPTLATIPAAILALMFGSNNFPELNHWIFMLVVILGYVLLNLVENQVLVPQILGDAVRLPPLIVLIGVAIAGATAGIAGVFLATPVIATGREILDYVYEKIIQAPELEPPEEERPSLIDRLRSFVGRINLPFRRGSQSKKDLSANVEPGSGLQKV